MTEATKRLIIGTYTSVLAQPARPGGGIGTAEWNGTTLADHRVLVETRDPSWIIAAPAGNLLYAVGETSGGDTVSSANASHGSVVAFALPAPEAGDAGQLGDRPDSGGAATCHLTLDPTNRFLIASNYSSGTVSVFAIADDGSIGAHVCSVDNDESGAHAGHAHETIVDTTTNVILAVDLGVDALIAYELSAEGTLSERSRLHVPHGLGPRHLVIHPDDEHAFLVAELGCEVLVLTRNRDDDGTPDASVDAGWSIAQRVSTLPEGFTGHAGAAEVLISPSGSWVLASNRLDENSVAVFGFDPESSSLEPVGIFDSHGLWPRAIEFSPEGDRLLVANQRSDEVAVFHFDDATGWLQFESSLAVPAPVCLLWA